MDTLAVKMYMSCLLLEQGDRAGLCSLLGDVDGVASRADRERVDLCAEKMSVAFIMKQVNDIEARPALLGSWDTLQD